MTALHRSSELLGPEAPDQRPWLVMLYLAGDNNLQEEMIAALQQLKAGRGDPEKTPEGDRIVAQFDPSAIGVATQRYDFSIEQNGDGSGIEDYRVDDGDLAETNTGNIEALVGFIKWASDVAGGDLKKYRHFLILSGHGSGTTQDFLLRDESPSDSLSIPELAEAMRLATGLIGKTIDILGMDACFMSMSLFPHCYVSALASCNLL